MAYGLDRRGEVQPLAAPAPNQASVPLVGVRGPNVRPPVIDTSINVMLGEVAKFGDTALRGLIEDQKKQDFLDGQAAFAQGKTLQDFQDAGGTYYGEKGWQAMEAQNAGALWAAAEKQKIADGGAELDPAEYRTGLSKSIVELTKGRDTDSTNMVMQIANKYLPELASEQMSANLQFRRARTKASAIDSIAVLSAADIDKEDLLGTIDRSIEGNPLSGMSDADYGEVLTQGILKAYEHDNPNAHAWLEEAGMLSGAHMSASNLAQLRSAKMQYENRMETKFNAEYTNAHHQLIKSMADGKISFPDALAQEQALQEQFGYRFDAGDAAQFENIQFGIEAQNRSEARADARQAEAEARQIDREKAREVKAQQYAMAWAQYQLDIMPFEAALASGDITPQDFLTKQQEMVLEMGLPYDQGEANAGIGAIRQAAAQAEIVRGKQLAVDQAIAINNFEGLTYDQQQQAVNTMRDRIGQKLQDGLAEGGNEQALMAQAHGEWMDWLDRSGLVDARTQGVFSTFLNGGLLDQSGKIIPEAERAFAEFVAMYNTNERMAWRHVKGDGAQARVRQMLSYYTGEGDFASALLQTAAAEQAASKMGYMPGKVLDNPVVVQQVTQAVDDFIDDNTVGVTDLIFGSTTWNQYWSTNDESLARASEAFKPVAKDFIEQQALALKNANPALDDRSAVEQAAQTLSERTIYLGGGFYIQPRGTDFMEKMFPGNTAYRDNPSIPNEALYGYLREHGKALFGEDLFSDLKLDPELQVIPAPNGEGVLVRVRRQQSVVQEFFDVSKSWTGAKPVLWRDIGMQYEIDRKKALDPKNRINPLGRGFGNLPE